MLTNVKKYVFKKLHAYHLKKSNYYYGKIDEWNADDNRYWGDKTAKHTSKCLRLAVKLNELEAPSK